MPEWSGHLDGRQPVDRLEQGVHRTDGGAILIGGAGAAGDVMVVNRLRRTEARTPDFGRAGPIFFEGTVDRRRS